MTKRNALIGMIAGAVLMVVAPVAGLLVTMLSLSQAFATTAGVAPEHKAQHLADGIGAGMNFTAFGIGGSVVGLLVLLVSLVLFVRAGKTAAP